MTSDSSRFESAARSLFEDEDFGGQTLGSLIPSTTSSNANGSGTSSSTTSTTTAMMTMTMPAKERPKSLSLQSLPGLTDSSSVESGLESPHEHPDFSHPSQPPPPQPQEPFCTPQNYKNVKPLQAAFMSTGLLSKRNRPRASSNASAIAALGVGPGLHSAGPGAPDASLDFDNVDHPHESRSSNNTNNNENHHQLDYQSQQPQAPRKVLQHPTVAALSGNPSVTLTSSATIPTGLNMFSGNDNNIIGNNRNTITSAPILAKRPSLPPNTPCKKPLVAAPPSTYRKPPRPPNLHVDPPSTQSRQHALQPKSANNHIQTAVPSVHAPTPTPPPPPPPPPMYNNINNNNCSPSTIHPLSSESPYNSSPSFFATKPNNSNNNNNNNNNNNKLHTQIPDDSGYAESSASSSGMSIPSATAPRFQNVLSNAPSPTQSPSIRPPKPPLLFRRRSSGHLPVTLDRIARKRGSEVEFDFAEPEPTTPTRFTDGSEPSQLVASPPKSAATTSSDSQPSYPHQFSSSQPPSSATQPEFSTPITTGHHHNHISAYSSSSSSSSSSSFAPAPNTTTSSTTTTTNATTNKPLQTAFLSASHFRHRHFHISSPSIPPPPAISQHHPKYQNQNQNYPPPPLSTQQQRQQQQQPHHLQQYLQQSSTERFENKFSIDALLGSGEFSDVYTVTDRDHGQIYAVKRTKLPFGGPKDRLRRLEEVDALRQVSTKFCPYLVKLYDAWEELGHLYIRTELCAHGNLADFLDDWGSLNGTLDEGRVWKILSELSQGLSHIHSCNIIHLDIKPANVFITDQGSLKIGDFGLATRWPRGSAVSIIRGAAIDMEGSVPDHDAAASGFWFAEGLDTRRGRCKSWGGVSMDIEREGDREYIAGEVLAGRYGPEADIFSLGLIILEAATNVILPDNGLPWRKLRSNDLSDVNMSVSSDLALVILGMLEKNPDRRLSTRDILEHPVIKTVRDLQFKGRLLLQGSPKNFQHQDSEDVELYAQGAVLPEPDNFLHDILLLSMNNMNDDFSQSPCPSPRLGPFEYSMDLEES